MPLSDVALPIGLRPPLAAVNGSSGVSQFYMMKDNSTGVLVLGSFSSSSFSGLQKSLLRGLLELREAGASRLIVDVVSKLPPEYHTDLIGVNQTNNGGGEPMSEISVTLCLLIVARLHLYCARKCLRSPFYCLG